jgi:hypothetical protein
MIAVVREMVAFPWAWATGNDKDAQEKAHKFVYTTSRVAFTCAVIWALYKGQQCESLRKITVPVPLFTMKLGRISLSLEPISLLITAYLVKTSESKWGASGYCAVWGVWQCLAQTFREWTKEPPGVSFSATFHQGGVNIDPYANLMKIALWKVPETRLGIGIFIAIFGVFQLQVYTQYRLQDMEVPTSLALKGIVHVLFGFGWIKAFGDREVELEEGAKRDTYFYKAADLAAPYLGKLATGRTTEGS